MNPRVTHQGVLTPGLPEDLPAGEEILWQGGPKASALARSVFHVRALGVYFAILLVLRGYNAWSDSQSALHTLVAVLWLLPFALVVIAMIHVMAWLTAKTTVYTVTNRRVVLHIGVVLDLTLNLPYERLEAVDLHVAHNGIGDVALRIMAPNKIAYVHLWPHARPWRVAHPEPMLRSLPDAKRIGELIAHAMAGADVSASQAVPAARAKETFLSHDQPLAAA